MYKIEDGVPLPRSKYPLSELEVGQSFLVESLTKTQMRSVRSSVYAIAHAIQGRKFVTRRVGDTALRVWRIV